MIFEGCFIDRQGIFAFCMYSMGYALLLLEEGCRYEYLRTEHLPSSVLGQSRVVEIN